MNPILMLASMVLYIVFAGVLFWKYGAYLKSLKPTGDKNRLLLRRWEEFLLIAAVVMWPVLLFSFIFSGYRDMVSNAMTGILLAAGISAVAPPFAPPAAYVPILAVLLRENRRRRKRSAAVRITEDEAL